MSHSYGRCQSLRDIPAHTVTIMLLSPESRKGCSSVGSVKSEKEQLTPQGSPTQAKTNFAVLQSCGFYPFVFSFFSFLPPPPLSCCLPHQLQRVICGAFREETDQLLLIKQLLGQMEHYVSLRLSLPPLILQNCLYNCPCLLIVLFSSFFSSFCISLVGFIPSHNIEIINIKYLQNFINLHHFSKSEKAEAVEIWHLCVCSQSEYCINHVELQLSVLCVCMWFRCTGIVHVERGCTAQILNFFG